MAQVTKPILLDETGKEILKKLQAIANAIIAGGEGGGIEDAPMDGNQYARQDGTWEQVLCLTPEQLAAIASVSNKVDKVAGKGLSTNDFTNEALAIYNKIYFSNVQFNGNGNDTFTATAEDWQAVKQAALEGKVVFIRAGIQTNSYAPIFISVSNDTNTGIKFTFLNARKLIWAQLTKSGEVSILETYDLYEMSGFHDLACEYNKPTPSMLNLSALMIGKKFDENCNIITDSKFSIAEMGQVHAGYVYRLLCAPYDGKYAEMTVNQPIFLQRYTEGGVTKYKKLHWTTTTDLPKNDFYGFIPLDDYDDVVVAYPNHRFGKAVIYISRCDIFESIAHQFKGLSARLSALESK